MKVIKRDGRAVDYDRQKILIAIGKANNEVSLNERASKEEIKAIMDYIEALGKKRMLVEDIQDIIEQKLMEFDKYNLAKKYIVYRYTRALVRKSNTTDESILGLIRNDNRELQNKEKNTFLASVQRNYIASEVSRDLTKRLLLPEKITKADQDGVLYFHNSDYFVQPIFNSCLVNLKDMLDNGTIINGRKINSPTNFQSASTLTTQIIANVASNQYGEQSVDLIHLGKYIRKSCNQYKNKLKNYQKQISPEILNNVINDMIKSEITSGVQTLLYEINNLITSNGCPPAVTFFLHLDDKDEYLKENVLLIEEILNQIYTRINKNDENSTHNKFPPIVYVLDEFNNLSGGKYDYLTKMALKCSMKNKSSLAYISSKKIKELNNNNLSLPMGHTNFSLLTSKSEGMFNQGIVTINLPQIGIISDGNESEFWNLLEERLELCKEALMCRHYALLGTISDISPIHWQNGAISRLLNGDKIDDLLKGNNSTLSLGYIGLEELCLLIKNESIKSEEGHKFTLKVLKKLRDKVNDWKKETNIGFNLYATQSKRASYKFLNIDRENFGTIKGITDKSYYNNAYYTKDEYSDNFEKIKLEGEFQDLSDGGAISYIKIPKSEEDLEKLIIFAYNNINYIEFI